MIVSINTIIMKSPNKPKEDIRDVLVDFRNDLVGGARNKAKIRTKEKNNKKALIFELVAFIFFTIYAYPDRLIEDV